MSFHRYSNPHSSLLSIVLTTFARASVVVIVLLVLVDSGAGVRAVPSSIQSTFSTAHPSILEYACHVFHRSLPGYLYDEIEQIQ